MDYCTCGTWFVVNTQSRHEHLAKGEIAQCGFVVYLPLILVRENGGHAPRMSERPMFPSYLFAHSESRAELWRRIASARGVHGLLGPAKDGEIEVVRFHEAQEAGRHAQRKSGLIWHFSPEDEIRIKSGPFCGFYARLKSAVDKHDRVRALLSMFGRDSVLDLSAHDIEASGA
jgi:transcription termination/antitermination protein NusG